MRLADHPSGLFTISVCVMSNFSKSRVLALQLLTKMCSVGRGHKQVCEKHWVWGCWNVSLEVISCL